MKNRNSIALTAIYKLFTTTGHKLPLVNMIGCVCFKLVGNIAVIKNALNLNLKRGHLIIIAMLLGLFSAGSVHAQTTGYGYDEEEYDGTYDYDFDYDPYSTDEVRKYYRTEKEHDKYKRSVRDEELYNGRYRKGVDNTPKSSGAGWGTIGWKNSKESAADAGNSNDNAKARTPGLLDRLFGTDGENKNTNPEMFTPDGSVAGGSAGDEPGKGSANGDDNNDFGPPPPPDEPDVPVDTAIPLLIAGGILIASFRLYKKKNASFE